MTTKFEAGKTYWTRNIVDADFAVEVTVARRTAKTIVTDDGKRLRISVYNGVEQVKPWGSYSMCPIVGADKCREIDPPVDRWQEANDAHAARQADADVITKIDEIFAEMTRDQLIENSDNVVRLFA